MKLHAAMFCMLIAASHAGLAKEVSISEIIYYNGTIASQEIAMSLEFIGSNVAGKYIYKKYKKPIDVTGGYNGKNINLAELHDGAVAANIHAIKKDAAFEGTWQDKKTYYFHVKSASKSYKDLIKSIAPSERGITIYFKNGLNQEIDAGTLTDSLSITFEDFTFDGYPDVRILELEGGGNSSYIYYEYDPSTLKYIKSAPEINGLINPLVIHGKKLLAGFIKDGCCSYSVVTIDEHQIRRAEYNYVQGAGKEKITDKYSQKVVERPISKEEFEVDYFSFVQKGSLQ
ncbi:hypothetical protein MCB86_18295 [Pseudomonas sp. KSR10]|uniref:XAC2610-related protein n=1 Tax=Pseudomonas sp. KSR10 TaxID=2916654 RepID=UPI001EF8CEBD|nr:hypothetical protein [Pseudomonas sp. KSR10]MCG6542028.1 hypothetical protein [Pseudomonas sp. KSR10]